MKRNELFERRKHRRVKIEAPAKHREVISDDFINEGRSFSPCVSVDMSKGGMQILTDEAWLDTGDRLVEIEFSMMGRAIKAIAHVVWFAYDDKLKKYRSGAEFIIIKSGDLELIGNLV